jgi:tRNA modification GTPase
MDTIYSLATGRGKAGVAVVRVSGPRAVDCAEHLAGFRPTGRVPSLRRLHDGDGALIDEALVLFFASGQSFTGEDVVEFQTHGSPAIVAAVLDQLSSLDGVRLAEPGEFTRRALENGCLDLAQVEGLADLIDAETEAQRKQAVRVFDGALGERTERWRIDLIRAAALLEATIDFADEDVPVDVTPEVNQLTTGVLNEINREIAGSSAAERIRDGFEVAILGEPNIGKSTLLNALAGRDAAITSAVAGTTRDVIEVRMDLKGLPVTFLDTDCLSY